MKSEMEAMAFEACGALAGAGLPGDVVERSHASGTKRNAPELNSSRAQLISPFEVPRSFSAPMMADMMHPQKRMCLAQCDSTGSGSVTTWGPSMAMAGGAPGAAPGGGDAQLWRALSGSASVSLPATVSLPAAMNMAAAPGEQRDAPGSGARGAAGAGALPSSSSLPPTFHHGPQGGGSGAGPVMQLPPQQQLPQQQQQQQRRLQPPVVSSIADAGSFSGAAGAQQRLLPPISGSAGSASRIVSPFASSAAAGTAAALWPHELQYLSAIGTARSGAAAGAADASGGAPGPPVQRTVSAPPGGAASGRPFVGGLPPALAAVVAAAAAAEGRAGSPATVGDVSMQTLGGAPSVLRTGSGVMSMSMTEGDWQQVPRGFSVPVTGPVPQQPGMGQQGQQGQQGEGPSLREGAAGTQGAEGAPGGGGKGAGEVVRMSRMISCKAYLKRLNITQPMAEALLPQMRLATAPRSGGCSLGQGAAGRHYEQLFKSEISLVDSTGRKWQLVYEGAVCNTQRHLRLTSGWRDFVRAHSIKVHDTVVFERRGTDRTTLYATIKRGGGLDGSGGEEGTQGTASGGGLARTASMGATADSPMSSAGAGTRKAGRKKAKGSA